MMKKQLLSQTLRICILTVFTLLIGTLSYAQTPIPFEIKNTSDYADSELFVAIVGISNDRHVWINMKTGQQMDMSPSYNTVSGPVYNGNKGPGQNGLYANCFTKLSDIPNKKINLAGIYGCRMFISVKSQLYFYFFGATGAQVGYTSPSHTDPSDPNKGIKYEIIELTYNQYGFWGNTTRVDSYQYPMGLELAGNDGSLKKTGELKSHAQIISDFRASVPTEFQSCYDAATTTILFPTKTVAWADGTIGTMPNRGPYVDYMQPYIDAVWNKYRNEDLIFSAGDAGVFRGRVSGNQLTMTCISGGFNGRVGIVQNKPTTQEALEGKGVLDRRINDGTVDLVVQAQLCAALTRHIVSLGANPGQQNWSVPSSYYKAAPCNYYAAFWHRTDISYQGLSYGFAYDDVFEQSATLHSPSPKSVLVLFGGYAKNLPTDPQVPSTTDVVTAYRDCNYSGFSGGLTIGDYNLAKLQALGIKNDDISSLRITQGYQAILYQDDNFSGASTVINSDNSCLNTTWNDKVTSVRIIANGITNLAGTYYLQNRNSGLNLDVAGGEVATGDGVKLHQWFLTSTKNQQFRFVHMGDGVYQIFAVHSGKAIDIDGISKADGAKVHQWTYNGTPNQQFIVVATDLAGCYKLIAKHSGKVVEVGGASTVNGADVQQWKNNNQTCGQWKFAAVGTTPVNGTGTGLTGNYFNGINFETPVYSRTDATINFNWNSGSPNAAVDADRFSARWTGQIQPRYSGEYTFYINSDNGRKLWINGQLVIDKWIDDWNIDYTGKITLTAGQKYDIKLEYFENYGGAGAKLEWSSASQSREVIPASQLYPNSLPSVSIASPANNASYTAPASITFTSSASDNGGSIAKVEYYNGATKIGESTSGSAYSFTWNNVAVGTYTVTARATDNLGGVAVSAAVIVKTTTTTTVNKAPTVSLTTPSNGTSLNAPASIAITATASDADGTVSKVEFYNGATKIGEDATAPYTYTLINATAGAYVISAKAIDNLGAASTSGSVTVTVVAVSTDACAGIAQYTENNGYVTGSKVKNGGKRYECKEWPYSGWCNGASWAYAPGSGAYWSDAWYDRGTCAARTGEADAVTIESAVLVSPNPSSGIVTIHVDAMATVTLYNAQGMEVMHTNVMPQGSLDMSNLSSGMYTVRIDTGSEVLTRMVVKN